MADRDFEIGGSSTFKRRYYEIAENVYAPAVAVAPVTGVPGGGAAAAPLVNASNTITLGGTSQTLIAEGFLASCLFVQNISGEPLYINFGGDPATIDDNSIKLLPDASLSIPGDINLLPMNAAGDASAEVTIIGATTGSKFIVFGA